jgi:hypothetical protein
MNREQAEQRALELYPTPKEFEGGYHNLFRRAERKAYLQCWEDMNEQQEQNIKSGVKEDILNELFPEFKARDWVVGWHSEKHSDELHKKAWQVRKVDCMYIYPVGLNSVMTYPKYIRHATPEEIEAATWKEGELYRVHDTCNWLVRVSAEKVGEFYLSGAYDGLTFEYDKYEKLNTCSCGFCVKEKEG